VIIITLYQPIFVLETGQPIKFQLN